MRLKLIACEMLSREMCAAISRAPGQVDFEFLPKALHNLGRGMRSWLQEVVNAVDPDRYDAVVLGYALCGNGVDGLASRAVPLVIPRAHDCIALLMGSRGRFREYFEGNPGVYFRSTGWLERGEDIQQAGYSLEELTRHYGDEAGRYLFEQLNGYRSAYRQLTYIRTGLEPDGRFEQQARTRQPGGTTRKSRSSQSPPMSWSKRRRSPSTRSNFQPRRTASARACCSKRPSGSRPVRM